MACKLLAMASNLLAIWLLVDGNTEHGASERTKTPHQRRRFLELVVWKRRLGTPLVYSFTAAV